MPKHKPCRCKSTSTSLDVTGRTDSAAVSQKPDQAYGDPRYLLIDSNVFLKLFKASRAQKTLKPIQKQIKQLQKQTNKQKPKKTQSLNKLYSNYIKTLNKGL